MNSQLRSTRTRFTRLAACIGAAALFACGGESSDATPQDDNAATTPAPVASTAPTLDADPDPALAAQGEEVFVTRACNACHTVGGGRLVGPDLTGVTERREPEWILAMILNPDSMVRTDSIARRLFAEYMTPMANQNLTQDEAVALFEYLRTASGN